MRLAQIKLAGFKSFVDPTLIPVAQDLIGIVGPNGCGKSNIIDAVRWVLGESKASALRGDSMQDVIFTGSDQRKAVGRASVEIIFDNSSSKITGQWSSYSEIAIKRVLQRDGISNYYINNQQVRRRDIADLFLGTGIGGRGYAIIEQGMISRIIEAKPQELRSFLEEAAGISQYRERRQETSSRLIETRKNLTRLEDICQELETQLQHLDVQAKIARQYQLLQDELRRSQVTLWLQRKNDALKQRTEAEEKIRQLESELENTFSNQRNAEQDYEKTRALEYLVNDKLLQTQGQLYTVNAEIGRLEQEINHLKNNRERLTQQSRDIENQLKKNNQLKVTTLENLRHWQREKTKAESAHAESILVNDAENQKLPDIEANFSRCQEELSKCRHELLIAEQTVHLENSHLTHAIKNIQQLEARHTRLLNEQTGLISTHPSQLEQLQQALDKMKCALQKQSLKQQTIEKQLAASTEYKQQITSKIQNLQHKLSQIMARFNALHTLQQKLESNQALTQWLNQRHLHDLPRLWQHISVTPAWENALEAILRERLNSIAIEQSLSIQNWMNDLPIGKWAVFEKTQTIQSTGLTDELPIIRNSTRLAKLLAHLTIHQIEIQIMLEDWLCHVYVAKDLQEGILERSTLNPGEVLVTPEGHMVTRNSITFYAPDSQLHGVLSRQQELSSIQVEIDQSKSQLRSQQDLLEAAEQQHSKLNRDMAQSLEDHQRLQQQQHALQLEIVKLSQINERTIHRNNQIDSELSEIKQALENELSLQKSTAQKLTENSEQIDTLNKLAQHVQSAWETANHLVSQQRQSVQLAMKKMQETAFHVKTCDHKISEIEYSLKAIEEDLQKLTENHIHLLKEIDSLDETPLKNLLEAAQMQRKTTEQAALQIRQEAEDTARYLRDIENIRLTSEQKTYSLQDAVNQIRLKEQAVNITINQLDEWLNEVKIDTKQLSQMSKKSMAALQSEINQLNADITALGPVNLAALEELENAHTRQSNLLMQLQDLNEAVVTLENAIQQIDRETQLRLQKTFDLVNQYLSEIFPVIFAGGQAKLELSEGKILDAGLLLMAQPPGKKNNSIHVLSGGEKALTALALIFSLFRLNPAPFCLLDEVDAPLDDANTNRFCQLVKNMARHTQFIFISHNKITMEMAQQLIGVTMQEQGVSRIVAVDIADAVKMGKRIQQAAI